MRFVRENRQMTNKKLYCEDVLQMLFAESDSEGEYLSFGNDNRPSNARASPGTSLLRNGVAGHGESVHKAQTSNNFGPLPNGDGGGSGEHGLSVHRRGSALLMIAPNCVFLSDRACSKCRWQIVQVQSVLVTLGLCAVPCNKSYHTLKNYKLIPRYLIREIAGQLIKK